MAPALRMTEDPGVEPLSDTSPGARSPRNGAPRTSWARRVLAPRKGGVDARADVFTSDVAATSGGPRRDIQALRAIAVAAVVAYHAFPASLPGGFIGVDVFFVVSGYLVGGALVAEAVSTGRVALLRFYARRLRRIAPLATVVALVTMGFAAVTDSPLRLILWGSPAHVASVTRDGLSSLLGVANLWFGFSDVGYVMNDYVSPFLHYWSLGVEEQFYLVAPLAVILAFRGGRKVELSPSPRCHCWRMTSPPGGSLLGESRRFTIPFLVPGSSASACLWRSRCPGCVPTRHVARRRR